METVTITCPHFNKDFDTDKLENLDCSNCGEGFLSIETKKCKECGNVHCLDCVEENFEGDFCRECSTITCSNCNNDYGREDVKKCAQCDNYLCSDCEYFDSEGLCINCTKEVVTCSSCGEDSFKSKVTQCKNFENCGNVYCDNDGCDDNLEDGLCESCKYFDCKDCGNEEETTSFVKSVLPLVLIPRVYALIAPSKKAPAAPIAVRGNSRQITRDA